MIIKLLFICLCSLTLINAASVASNLFAHRVIKGQVTNKHENYITGMAASRTHKNVLWMISSREGKSQLFAVAANTGAEVAWLNVTGANNYDWEDLAYGPCADDCRAGKCDSSVDRRVRRSVDRYCIYIADIGGHGGDGAKGNVYMIREPADLTPVNGSVFTGDVSVVDQLNFVWPEPDAETLMVAPDASLYVISKIEEGRGMIAKIPDSGWGGSHVVLNLADTGILKIQTTHADPQGGSISPDGEEMIIVCEEDVFYFNVADGDYITAVRTQVPERVASYVSVDNTEAITWSPDAQGFYTFARGSGKFIYYYPRNNNPVVG